MADGEADRRRQREVVRRGYDAISYRYRADAGHASPESDEDVSRYATWIDELRELVPPSARVLDLGCGAGVPGTRRLAEVGFNVVGVDFSAVQLARASALVPEAVLVQADMSSVRFRPASFDAIVSFYALIHLPLGDQQALFPRIRAWLRTGGYFLAIVGTERWTGVQDYLGAPMFWDHADAAAYLRWLGDAGLTPLWHRRIPEGEAAHTLVLAVAERG